jgi:hypothetical protein
LYGFGWGAIYQPYHVTSRFTPQSSWKTTGVQQRPDSFYDGAIPTFSNTIVLWRVMNGEFLFSALGF